MPWRSWSVFLLTPRVTDRSTRAAQGEAEAVHARPRLYGVHARWRSLSLVRGSHRVPEGKQDIGAGMFCDQPRPQSIREPASCYKNKVTCTHLSNAET